MAENPTNSFGASKRDKMGGTPNFTQISKFCPKFGILPRSSHYLKSTVVRSSSALQSPIHEKKELCGGDGFFGKKNWRKIWPKNGLKWPKIAKIWPKNGLIWPKMT